MNVAAFIDGRMIASGEVADVTAAVLGTVAGDVMPVVLDTATGAVVDLDLRRDPRAAIPERARTPARRGRPKLGVKAREVTLLPRHWDWLAQQRGGASAALRRLVEAQMRATAGTRDPRKAQDAAYRAATALAGDLPGYEEALRALYAGRLDDMATAAAAWPTDVRRFVLTLAGGTEAA